MKPKYEIGQAFSIKFTGEIEGFPVQVKQVLFVWAIRVSTNSSGDVTGFSYVFRCVPPVMGKFAQGKEFVRKEEDLTPMEPVIEAASKCSAALNAI